MDAPATTITLSVSHRGATHDYVFPADATLADLSDEIAAVAAISPAYQKLVVPGLGLLRGPFPNPDLPLASLVGRKITLVGTPDAAVSSLLAAESRALARQAARREASSSASSRRRQTPQRAPPADKYRFALIRPLEWLPRPERSLAMLNRLAADPGIRSAMRTHQFSVALLTEMEPLAHTTASHEGVSRTLGLNRNRGEVIELRLRTDAHDGYRDYATVRRTLCHELAHNVHGPHDSKFWALCRQIEREVESVGSGRMLGGGEDGASRYMAPARGDPMGEDEGDAEDAGGWTGGEFVLGGRSAGELAAGGLTRREIVARAVEERARREEEEEERRRAGA
jgi:hypothetical protein